MLDVLVIGGGNAALCAALTSCAAQTPLYRREHLVDPIMSFDQQARLEMRKMKAFEAREAEANAENAVTSEVTEVIIP